MSFGEDYGGRLLKGELIDCKRSRAVKSLEIICIDVHEMFTFALALVQKDSVNLTRSNRTPHSVMRL